MFHIFIKKRFLVDALHGFVDIHNHILPGIDDGAKTVEESIALIKEFGSFGVTNFIATPHIMNDYYPNTPETIKASYSLLKDELIKEGLSNISLDTAAEHMIDGTFELMLEKELIMPLPSSYLLVEMSYLQQSINFNNAIVLIANKGYLPILAHPERYNFINRDSGKFISYKNKGIQFQLNLLSLGNYYGPQVQKKAHKLLDEGLIDFVATDVHNIRHLTTLKNMKVSENLLQKILPLVNNTIGVFH